MTTRHLEPAEPSHGAVFVVSMCCIIAAIAGLAWAMAGQDDEQDDQPISAGAFSPAARVDDSADPARAAGIPTERRAVSLPRGGGDGGEF